MSDRYKRRVPKQVKTVRPLEPAASRPKPAKPAAQGPRAGAQQAERQGGGDKPSEIGGPSGPEPTRYGDWEINGRCVDF